MPCTVMDLFTRAMYTAFHAKEPPAGWREATAADIRRAANNEHPHCVFISSPCKGASGLLSEALSRTPKYQALNELTLRCVWLMCEAWKDDPVELIVFENVPRLATRGRHLLDQINQILRHYGYAVNETTHDCGEIGGLAQSRKRFLLVARHMEKVPAVPLRAGDSPPAGRRNGARPHAAARRSGRWPDAPCPLAAVEDLGAPGVRRGRQRLAEPKQVGGGERASAGLPDHDGAAQRRPRRAGLERACRCRRRRIAASTARSQSRIHACRPTLPSISNAWRPALGQSGDHHRRSEIARPGVRSAWPTRATRPGQAQQRVPDRGVGPGRRRRHERPRHRPVRAGPARVGRL
ncbi:DNA cytosine methyltransferase [Cupriavidus basilensis]